MKELQAACVCIAFLFALIFILHAQEAEVPAIQIEPLSLKPADLQSFTSLSEAQVTALFSALDATPTIAADTLPKSGTFWSLANPTWPPLPGNINSLSAWTIDGGSAFLLNDIGFDYSAQTGARTGMRILSEEDGPPGFDDIGEGGTNAYESSYSARVYTTNELWLSITGITNTTAYLVIHPPWNVTNSVYDLLYCTNLAPPVSWRWLLRSNPGQTNLIVPNATDPQGFYQLSSPNDLTANSSLGTNFWVAFCGLYVDEGQNELSLFISSPVGATGMVTTPGLTANGPVLVVINCGDASVNGTYLLTNLTTQEQTDWQLYNLSATDVSYASGTNWVVFHGGRWSMFKYDGGAHVLAFLYSKDGINLNGSAADWYFDGDTNAPPTPTTMCAQILLVNQPFTVAAGAVTNISIPLEAMLVDYDVVATNGIHITASQPVSVYGLDYDQFATTAFTGYPTPLLGTNYCVMARASMLPFDEFQFGYYSQLSIVAPEDNTTVTITPSPMANLEGHTNAYTEILQQGETYQINSINNGGDDYTNDVTGTLITSDKPIVVFAGASAARVPDQTYKWSNPLVQEQMPVESWGRQALALSFAGRMGGDSYRVLAATTNTIVFTNGVVAGTNQAGQCLDLLIAGPVEFQGSQPIQVAHFANGTDFDGANGDPCEILLPPAGHYLETNIVATGPGLDFSVYPPAGFDANYLNIIVAQSAITNTLVDGLPVSATNFVAIGTSGYYGAQIPVATGSHTVSSSQPMGVEVYGFGVQDAYGYFGGIVK